MQGPVNHPRLMVLPQNSESLHFIHSIFPFSSNQLQSLLLLLYFPDDENSHVHAILTHDNLLDGTIDTATEHFYVEPAHRYSKELPRTGVHSIVYKLSDVKMDKSPDDLTSTSSSLSASSFLTNHAEHCASERLRKKHFFAGGSVHYESIADDRKKEQRWWEPQNGDVEKRSENMGGDIETNQKESKKDVSSRTILLHNRHKRWLPDEVIIDLVLDEI